MGGDITEWSSNRLFYGPCYDERDLNINRHCPNKTEIKIFQKLMGSKFQ